MRIRHFSATGVHGYLKFDIKFNKDITFLTGINGSGKTSVVYSIVSLITPSLFILANLEFAHMKVVVDQDDETITIEAKRTDNIVSLTTSKTEDAFIIPKFIPEPDDPPFRVSDAELQFYRNLTSEQAPHPVIQVINTLPTPMFLDLDRRARATSERSGGRLLYSRFARRGRNIFNAPLSQSLSEATQLAEAQNQELTRGLLRLSDQLRRDIILNLLTMEAGPSRAVVTSPSQQDRATISMMRSTIGDLPHILQISAEDVQSKILPFLDRLEEAVQKIPVDAHINALVPSSTIPEILEAFVYWYSNHQQLNIFNSILQRIEKFNRDRTVSLSS
jgi:hypothetical protein